MKWLMESEYLSRLKSAQASALMYNCMDTSLSKEVCFFYILFFMALRMCIICLFNFVRYVKYIAFKYYQGAILVLKPAISLSWKKKLINYYSLWRMQELLFFFQRTQHPVYVKFMGTK